MNDKTTTAEWVTYEEAQKITGLGKTTLWRIAKAGLIPVSTHGRAKRLHRNSLEEYMWSRVPGGRDEDPEDQQ